MDSVNLDTRERPSIPVEDSVDIYYATSELVQKRLWPLIEKVMSLGEDRYKSIGTFSLIWLGNIVVSTDDELNTDTLSRPRNGEKNGKKVSGGHAWDTFARTCFGWDNLIMAEGKKHSRLSQTLGPLFKEKAVKEKYFNDLKAVTEDTVKDWALKGKDGIKLLDAALEHSCRSVTTCFLGEKAAKSQEIVEAVRNLMGVFWGNVQYEPWAVIYRISRFIFCGCCGDPDDYWKSHAILEDAIEEARLKATKESFIGRLLGDPEFTEQELIDNMKMLYFAGTETTGSLITTILAKLKKEDKEKLLEELQLAGIFSLDNLEYDILNDKEKLPILHAVFYEALRLVPPIPIQSRDEIDLETQEKRTVFINHYLRLRDRDLVGPDPDQFYPERILENPKLIPEIEKTFGGGLTPCQGKPFAKTETLLLIAAMILESSFEIEGDTTEIIREAGAHLSPDLKIHIHLKKD